MSKLVIVESPTKAKTIEKYLPKGYVVRASVGHVRDLPDKASQMPEKYRKETWAHLGVDVTGDFEPVYVVKDKRSREAIQELKSQLAGADELILATDEDREGEAIGWHLIEVLKPQVPVKRMVFHEITRTAIQEALTQTRSIDEHLVQAQEARRILDRLVGYPLSLLIAKKIKYGLSAGRVQSVAVRLLVERERERRRFQVGSYWDLKGDFERRQDGFDAVLRSIGGVRIATGKDFDEHTGKIAAGKNVLLLEEPRARALETDLQGASWRVLDVQHTPYTTSPRAPFTTSTLQQEASRKLGLSAREAMSIAQRLYESGLITYMRTDSTNLSQQAIDAARQSAQTLYGSEYVPQAPRIYRSKAKGAQEAHEAIRPTGDDFVLPARSGLHGRELQVYELIWKRTVACQMVDARSTRTRADLETMVHGESVVFRANGKRIDFPGYLKAYVEGSDDPEASLEDQERPLPALTVGEEVVSRRIEAIGHETKPPARYTEASLVKALEENGIGRPSTYATILSKIVQSTTYARKVGQALVPTYMAFAATALLERYFPDLVNLEFTAHMEDDLDEIAQGKGSKVSYLHQFYRSEGGFAQRIESGERDIDPSQARVVELEDFPATMKVGRYGPYVQVEEGGETRTANVPEEVAPADLSLQHIQDQIEKGQQGPVVLGQHPEYGVPVYLKQGPYGPYVQLGDEPINDPGKKGPKAKKPKRCSVPKGEDPAGVDFDRAMQLLSLPRTVGKHPDGKVVQTGLGRFGPYLKHGSDFRSLPDVASLFSLELEAALAILAEPKRRGRGAKVLREVGVHPESGEAVTIYEGRYGPYMKFAAKNITVPRDRDPQTLTLDEALALIQAKGGAKKKPAKKKAAKKKAGKKKAAKSKAPAKKKAAAKVKAAAAAEPAVAGPEA